jgi:Autoinducer binding domain
LLRTYDEVSVERHAEQNYFRTDPVVIAGSKSFLPIDWLTVERHTPATRHFSAEAESYIAELRTRATEADAQLKRLHDAIENGITDLSDLMPKDRIAELKAIRDQARADAEWGRGRDRTPGTSHDHPIGQDLCQGARKRMRIKGGGYRRDYLSALPQRVEVGEKELVSWGRKANRCARSSPLQAQNRRVLACPVLYRSGAPDTIRTCDLHLRRVALYPAELRVHAAYAVLTRISCGWEVIETSLASP